MHVGPLFRKSRNFGHTCTHTPRPHSTSVFLDPPGWDSGSYFSVTGPGRRRGENGGGRLILWAAGRLDEEGEERGWRTQDELPD